jgi:hypothetical protein
MDLGNLVSIIDRSGVEGFGRYYSVYRGIVITRETDDENYTGRLFISVSGLDRSVNLWALPKYNHGYNGGGFKGLDPLPGTMVFVEFERGNPARPLWSFHGWSKGECPESLRHPEKMGIVTPEGHSIVWNDNKGTLDLKVNPKETEGKIQIQGGPAEGDIEPLVKGTQITEILSELITAIKQITVPTPNGTSGYPLNVADFIKLESRLSKKEQLSKLIFIQ